MAEEAQKPEVLQGQMTHL
jgi:hypothetical protein